MEGRVHTHTLYVGDDVHSQQAKKKLEELSREKKNFEYSLVKVENPEAMEVSLPYLLTDEGEFSSVRDIEWFVEQYLKGNLSTR